MNVKIKAENMLEMSDEEIKKHVEQIFAEELAKSMNNLMKSIEHELIHGKGIEEPIGILSYDCKSK